ncbi:MAG: hypothetical protein ACTHMJ_08250 [Thermomicrobiales bacterium]|jgi:hypothetical protein
MSMGTSGTQQTSGSAMHQHGAGSPIGNEAYNVLTALQSKLEGLAAYRQYQQSSQGSSQIWQQLSQLDNQAAEMLAQELERLVRDGKFRMQSSSQTH